MLTITPPEPRFCPWCGAKLVRHPHEAPIMFARRKCCSLSHARLYITQRESARDDCREVQLPSAFLLRVADAMMGLRAGQDVAELRARHGGIVMEEARLRLKRESELGWFR